MAYLSKLIRTTGFGGNEFERRFCEVRGRGDSLKDAGRSSLRQLGLAHSVVCTPAANGRQVEPEELEFPQLSRPCIEAVSAITPSGLRKYSASRRSSQEAICAC